MGVRRFKAQHFGPFHGKGAPILHISSSYGHDEAMMGL